MDLGGPPAGFFPRFNPFFFLCTHHGELEGAGLAEGGAEVLLTFQVTGNPTAYTPGQEYQGERVHPSCPASLAPSSYCDEEMLIYHLQRVFCSVSYSYEEKWVHLGSD